MVVTPMAVSRTVVGRGVPAREAAPTSLIVQLMRTEHAPEPLSQAGPFAVGVGDARRSSFGIRRPHARRLGFATRDENPKLRHPCSRASHRGRGAAWSGMRDEPPRPAARTGGARLWD